MKCPFLSVAGQEKKEEDNIQFVFITANKNEYDSLMSFLKHPKGKLQDPVTCDDIDELKGRFEMKERFKDYQLFSVRSNQRTVNCAVLKCLSFGSSGRYGSRMETLKLLITARDQRWSPEAIFLIGYCGGKEKQEDVTKCDAGAEVGSKVPKSVVGCVCIANKVVHYNRGKIEGEGEMNWSPATDYGSEDTIWYQNVQNEEAIGHHMKEVPYKAIDKILSGDHVVKSKDAADKLSQYLADKSIAAFEMEGLGVAEALEVAKMINEKVTQGADHKIPMPEYVIVKGISDLVGHDKNLPCNIQFFGEEKKDVEEVRRQQMCTIMAATLVLRAIVHYA